MAKAAETCAVTVAVRSRPPNERERGTRSCLEFNDDRKTVRISTKQGPQCSAHTFTFDFAYDDAAPQRLLFDDIGKPVVKAAFDGFNACIFAYGQTGSGKSFAMMGPPSVSASSLGSVDVTSMNDAVGLIPRIISAIFVQAKTFLDENECDARNSASSVSCARLAIEVEVSYLEIYQERVYCLLDATKQNLKVRQHPTHGVFVELLTKDKVLSPTQALLRVERGNANRQTAATAMNERSSRSHAVFSIIVTQTRTSQSTDGKETTSVRRSHVNLVDLAGSERAKSTGAEGDTLREGALINQSLTTLGLVISGLAELSSAKAGAPAPFIPYRNSQLTFILKENLGGSSKTFMLSTLSPSEMNAEETLGTLRYADRAKSIKTKAFVNEDTKDKMIRELQSEIQKYKKMIEEFQQRAGRSRMPDLALGDLSNLQEGGERDSYWVDEIPRDADEAEMLKHQVDLAEELMVEDAQIAVDDASSTASKYGGPYILNVDGAGAWTKEPCLTIDSTGSMGRKDIVFGTAPTDIQRMLWSKWFHLRFPRQREASVKCFQISHEDSPSGFPLLAPIHCVISTEPTEGGWRSQIVHLGGQDMATFIDELIEVPCESDLVIQLLMKLFNHDEVDGDAAVEGPIPSSEFQAGHALQIGSEFVTVKLKDDKRPPSGTSTVPPATPRTSRLMRARRGSVMITPRSSASSPPQQPPQRPPLPLVPSLALGKQSLVPSRPLNLSARPSVQRAATPRESGTPRVTASGRNESLMLSASQAVHMSRVEDLVNHHSHTFVLLGDAGSGKSAFLYALNKGDLGFFGRKVDPPTSATVGCTISRMTLEGATESLKAEATFVDISGHLAFAPICDFAIPETRTTFLLTFPLDGRGGSDAPSPKAIDLHYYKKLVEAIQLRCPTRAAKVILLGTFRDRVSVETPFLSQSTHTVPSDIDEALGRAVVSFQRDVEMFWQQLTTDSASRPEISAIVAFSARDRTASLWKVRAAAKDSQVAKVSHLLRFLADHAINCSKRDEHFSQGLVPSTLLTLARRLEVMRKSVSHTNSSRLLAAADFKKQAAELDSKYDKPAELHKHTQLITASMHALHFHRNPKLQRFIIVDPYWFLDSISRILLLCAIVQKQLLLDSRAARTKIALRSFGDPTASWDDPVSFAARYAGALQFPLSAINVFDGDVNLYPDAVWRSVNRGFLTVPMAHLILMPCVTDSRPPPNADSVVADVATYILDEQFYDARNKAVLIALDALERSEMIISAGRVVCLSYAARRGEGDFDARILAISHSTLQIALASPSVTSSKAQISIPKADRVPSTPRGVLNFFKRSDAAPPRESVSVPTMSHEQQMLFLLPTLFELEAPNILVKPPAVGDCTSFGSFLIDNLLSGPSVRIKMHSQPPMTFFRRLVGRLSGMGKGIYIGHCGKQDRTLSAEFETAPIAFPFWASHPPSGAKTSCPFWCSAVWVLISDTCRVLVRMTGTRTLSITLHEWSDPLVDWMREELASADADDDEEDDDEFCTTADATDVSASQAEPGFWCDKPPPVGDALSCLYEEKTGSEAFSAVLLAAKRLMQEIPGLHWDVERLISRRTSGATPQLSSCGFGLSDNVHPLIDLSSPSNSRAVIDEANDGDEEGRWLPLSEEEEPIDTFSWPLPLSGSTNDVDWEELVMENVSKSFFLSSDERNGLRLAVRRIAWCRERLVIHTKERGQAAVAQLRVGRARRRGLERTLTRGHELAQRLLVEEVTALDVFVDVCATQQAFMP